MREEFCPALENAGERFLVLGEGHQSVLLLPECVDGHQLLLVLPELKDGCQLVVLRFAGFAEAGK